jgi:AcrR family transcriptional regulator
MGPDWDEECGVTNKKAMSLARALDAGVELISTRGLDQVSIAEIAAAGRCSTATIYDVFGSKERMLDEIIERGRQVCDAPRAGLPETPADALECLLNFLTRRVEFLSASRTAGMFKASLSRSIANAEKTERLFAERDPLPRVTILIEQAMTAGDFRQIDPATCAYCVLATVSFEPLLANLWFSESVNIAALIGTAVSLHLTPAGIDKLSAWTSACNTEGASSDRVTVGGYAFLGHRLAE